MGLGAGALPAATATECELREGTEVLAFAGKYWACNVVEIDRQAQQYKLKWKTGTETWRPSISLGAMPTEAQLKDPNRRSTFRIGQRVLAQAFPEDASDLWELAVLEAFTHTGAFVSGVSRMGCSWDLPLSQIGHLPSVAANKRVEIGAEALATWGKFMPGKLIARNPFDDTYLVSFPNEAMRKSSYSLWVPSISVVVDTVPSVEDAQIGVRVLGLWTHKATGNTSWWEGNIAEILLDQPIPSESIESTESTTSTCTMYRVTYSD